MVGYVGELVEGTLYPVSIESPGSHWPSIGCFQASHAPCQGKEFIFPMSTAILLLLACAIHASH
jgi:hypothetical protein